MEIPRIFFPVKSEGEGYSELNVFDNCLIEAGIGDINLVKVSSIVPPHCKRSEPVHLSSGSLVPIAYAFIFSKKPGEVISAAVAIALPVDEDQAGLIMEYGIRASFSEASRIVEEMAKEGFERRNRKFREIIICGAEHRVVKQGGAFAGTVLWY